MNPAMSSAAVPVEIADEINAKILAVSEDQLHGFQRDPFGAVAERAELEKAVVLERVRAMLEVTDRDSIDPVEDVMQVFNEAGVPVYGVGVLAEGGRIRVAGKDGKRRKSVHGTAVAARRSSSASLHRR